MATFIYAPGIRVHIRTMRHGIVDVSRDITSGNLTRITNGVSKFGFNLKNPQRKYDGIFTPNDAIVVEMKRVKWVRVFSGYLDVVPFTTVYPRTVTISASCTLKRLQYWFWDPHSQAGNMLLHGADDSTSAENAGQDGGMGKRAIKIMRQVADWPEGAIHIGKIPPDWFQQVAKVYKEIEADAEAQALLTKISADSSIGGSGSADGALGSSGVATGPAAANSLPAGSYGGTRINQAQAENCITIYNVCMKEGGSTRDAAMGIMTAMVESTLVNVNHGDRDSLGLFQQRDAWGSAAARTTPAKAAKMFFQGGASGQRGLFDFPNRASTPMGKQCQLVQVSAFPDRYANHQRFAEAAVAHIAKHAGGGTSAQTASTAGVATPNAGSTTNNAKVQSLIKAAKTQLGVPYRYGGTNPKGNEGGSGDGLDCSGFSGWSYRQIGVNLPRTAEAQYQATKQNTVQGESQAGDLLFWDKSGRKHHVTISLGGGQMIAAPHTGDVVKIQAIYGNPVATRPMGGAGGGVADATSTGGLGSADPNLSLEGEEANDVNNNMFRLFAWNTMYEMDIMGVGLGGSRSLMNDEALLPTIDKLMTVAQREYCSAPNGDFIAWFPDYFGRYGYAAKMVIQDIELQDFTMTWSDAPLITHQFVTGSPIADLSQTPGGGASDPIAKFTTAGIASVDFPQIVAAITGLDKGTAELYAKWVLKRFGARQDFQAIPEISGKRTEFLFALMKFLQHWSDQFSATVPITFMPELYPGMIIQVPSQNFQAYVKEVRHSFSFADGGGFQTQVGIIAPSTMDAKGGFVAKKLIGEIVRHSPPNSQLDGKKFLEGEKTAQDAKERAMYKKLGEDRVRRQKGIKPPPRGRVQ